MSIVESDEPLSWSLDASETGESTKCTPQFRSHQETKMAARRTQRSTSTISRKNHEGIVNSLGKKVFYCTNNCAIFNNYPAKSHGISSAKIRRYSARLSRIIILLFNKLITKLVTFLNLSVDIFSLHFFPHTKIRIPPDICYLWMTDIESIMTIFG